MKRTCLHTVTIGNQCSEAKLNTDEQNSCELNRRSPLGKISGTKCSKFHLVEQLFEKRTLEPKDNQFVKSFVRMKRTKKAATIVFMLSILLGYHNSIAQTYSVDVKQIESEIKAHNKAVHVFDDWMRDPDITIGPDGYYYLTCTQYTKESEGIKQPVYRSKDLATWEFIGFPYSLKDATNYDQYLKIREEKNKNGDTWGADDLKLWAPEMHFIKDRWVVVHTSNAGIGNFVVASPGKEFKGPFTNWGSAFGSQHDPSLFVDDDGSVWMAARCADITKVKSDLSGFDGEPIKIGPSDRKMGHEGTFIIKFENKYVLFGTAWSTDNMRKGTYNLYYCTADKVTGPYNERKFAGRFLGHGVPFEDKNGNWWCTAFYNASKPALSAEEIKGKDMSDNAYTINKQGLTLVPMSVKMVDGDVDVSAIDSAYRFPGSEEVQIFKK